MTDRRYQKKLIIGLVYVSIIMLLIAGVYPLFQRAPTCTDGKKNQDETGIDCGGICGACKEELVVGDMVVLETAWVPSGKLGEYDILARISNINDDVGASSFDYVFRVFGKSGEMLTEIPGSGFILPKDDRYVFEMSVPLPQDPSRVELDIQGVQWERLSDYRENPPIRIYNVRYEPISSGIGFGRATGLVVNESSYDFESVMILMVLRDASGNPVAIHENEMRTLKAREQRDFTLIWPDPFPGDVTKVEVRALVNIYRSDSFIRQYLPAGASQQFQDLSR